MIEPHTNDDHDFGEDCPDCGSVCAEALEELLAWVTRGQRNRKLCEGKVAALYVISKKATIKEACLKFNVSRMTMHKNMKDLAKQFGLRIQHGRLL